MVFCGRGSCCCDWYVCLAGLLVFSCIRSGRSIAGYLHCFDETLSPNTDWDSNAAWLHTRISMVNCFDSLYLSVPRAADEKKIILTLTATDFSQETEYGSVVDGVGKLNGKLYNMRIYLPKDADIQPGDRLIGRFSLRSTLPGCTGESQYNYSRGVFLSA